ncbi:hypothetical protein VD0002_g5607 [Verticillium dahliae]|uniref:Uncharacterized protein n=1 Tax=Verticillium dahliae TaxID=27337 RepID=A0AA44W7T6_VERDA|nr:hypothetical protein BJF96_g10238 [Verticillium dahliae]PNH50001.1 hypothetical protein VD0003_g7161 [Verticillium dahliae]PNH62472.1 hypothetical protein VD0002_g5607 [Verticillium dahliae]
MSGVAGLLLSPNRLEPNLRARHAAAAPSIITIDAGANDNKTRQSQRSAICDTRARGYKCYSYILVGKTFVPAKRRVAVAAGLRCKLG